MSNQDKVVKEKFDALFADWERVIQDPETQISSRPHDYADNEPFRGIVELGAAALPFIIEKLEQGVFLLNQAVIEIAGIDMDDILGKERRFVSEQEKARLLVEWWRSQQG